MAALSFREVRKRYGDVEVVHGITADVADGEFVVIVGPSGCGKSTLLRMVAGLEAITSGEIRIGERVVNDLEPKDRDIAMVFQNYALYPHMSVYDNMAFGLRRRKVAPAEVDRLVRETAATLGLETYLPRRPRELSGGERQRVALGRALVRRPQVYLFDEPLSSLDAQLRQELREELARLHRLTRTTSIYVTHDQKEALSLGDKVAVMSAGTLRQVASPEAVYREPHDLFVARFVGEPAINLIEGQIAVGGGTTSFHAPGFRLTLNGSRARSGPATLGLRAEAIALVPGVRDAEGSAVVERIEHLGGDTLVHLKGAWGGLVARLQDAASAPAPGATVEVRPDPKRALFFGPDGTRL